MKVIIRDRFNSTEPGDPVRGSTEPAHDMVTSLHDVLGRHGAQILRPAAGASASRTTIHRSAALRIPDSVLGGQTGQRSLLSVMNDVLAEIGYRLAEPPRLQVPTAFGRYERDLREHAYSRVRLESVSSPQEPVDAWQALQRLCAAAGSVDPRLGLVELEHLLIGAVLRGSSPGVLKGDPSTEGHPASASFPWPGSGGHAPVTVVASQPSPRRPRSEIAGGRRPVVAVLDTGLASHPWLDASEQDEDSFILIDEDLQKLVVADEIEHGQCPLHGPWDVTAPPSGEDKAGDDAGHGTFIAGIIRQHCPDARVLSVRLMHDDGVIYENDLLLVLAAVLARNTAIQRGVEPDHTKFVDVISLSAGYYLEQDSDEGYTSKLLALIRALSRSGVLIVASAGNDATERPCYPAALPRGDAALPVVLSVGALDPDGDRAPFSNYGWWVDCWASGAAVISTAPTPERGRRDPRDEADAPPLDGRAGDPGGSNFNSWSGTSFAAPLVAAELAMALIANADKDSALSMDKVDQETTLDRAISAFTACCKASE